MFDEQVTPEEQKPTDQSPSSQEQDQNQNQNQNANENHASQEDNWFEVDGRKYNPESATKKISHQDQHISKLEQELADLREQTSKLDKIDKLEELLNQQQQSQQPASEQPPQNEQTNSFNEEEFKSKMLSELEQKIVEQKQAEAAQSNVQKATEQAKELYGSGYAQKLEQIGQELGMDKDSIKNMAANQPNVFNRLFLQSSGSNPKPAPQQNHIPPRGNSQGQDIFKEAANSLLDRKTPAREKTDMIANLLKQAQS
jgi:hypothetical protein